MEEQIWSCVLKRLTGTETVASALILDQWLAADPANVRQYQEAEAMWKLSGQMAPAPPALPFHQFRNQLSEARPVKKMLSSAFWKYGIAAAVTFIFLLSGLYYYKWNPAPAEEWMVMKADAGKLIQLSLPDSSKVWLNAGSKITFAKGFTGKKTRTVHLEGEAYFEVKHDEKRPFVVNSGKLKTTVYGTSFSIRAYPNEAHTSVAVNSGKVGVTGEDQGHQPRTVMLLPNDKLSYSHRNSAFLKTEVLNKDVDGWVRGDLIFEQTPVPEVFETLSRKYNVKIDAGTQNYASCKLTAKFNNQPLQAVLKVIHLSLNISSTQIGNTIYLKGGKACNN